MRYRIRALAVRRATRMGKGGSIMENAKPLTPELLCRRCDPGQFSFQTTTELENLAEVLGQPRAMEAIQFGIGMTREGYNLFSLGPAGVGKYFIVR